VNFDPGTVDGLISNFFIFGPGIITLIGIRYLCRNGFFGPHQ
jgi:hypothetical protein